MPKNKTRTAGKTKSLEREASAAEWNSLYQRHRTPWRTGGLSETTRRLLMKYAPGPRFLELGCGVADDASDIAGMQFEYLGLDVSEAAIREAISLRASDAIRFVCSDFFRWSPNLSFDVIYDRGLFHGLGGVRRRSTFTRRVASLLGGKGVWITVCGSADDTNPSFCHGAIYLRDVVMPVEIYFEVLEVVKASYGLEANHNDFEAWHAVFRKR